MGQRQVQQILDAMKEFRAGARRLQINRSIQQANEQVQQIRDQELNDAEKNEQIRQVSSNLQLNLLQNQAAPGFAKAAGSALEPQEQRTFSNPFEAITSGNKEEKASAINFLGFTSGIKQEEALALSKIRSKEKEDFLKTSLKLKEPQLLRKEELATEKREKASKDKITNLIRKQLERFTDKEGKSELDSLSRVNQLDNLLASGNASAFELGKRIFIRLAGDPRPSDADVKGVSPNPDFVSAAKRLAKKNFTIGGRPTEFDLADMRTLARGLREGAERTLRQKVSRFANSRAGLIPGITTEEFANRLNQSVLGIGEFGKSKKPEERKVRVRLPNGKTGKVVESKVKELIRRGAEIIN